MAAELTNPLAMKAFCQLPWVWLTSVSKGELWKQSWQWRGQRVILSKEDSRYPCWSNNFRIKTISEVLQSRTSSHQFPLVRWPCWNYWPWSRCAMPASSCRSPCQLWQQICVMIVSYSNLVAVLQAFERTAWEYRSHSVDITEASKHSCRRSVGACYLAELSFLEGGCWRNQCLCRKPQTGLCLLRRNRMTISRFGKLCHDISNGATFIPSESISFLVFSLFALLLMRICIYIYIC